MHSVPRDEVVDGEFGRIGRCTFPEEFCGKKDHLQGAACFPSEEGVDLKKEYKLHSERMATKFEQGKMVSD